MILLVNFKITSVNVERSLNFTQVQYIDLYILFLPTRLPLHVVLKIEAEK